jgi:hypothetical protein
MQFLKGINYVQQLDGTAYLIILGPVCDERRKWGGETIKQKGVAKRGSVRGWWSRRVGGGRGDGERERSGEGRPEPRSVVRCTVSELCAQFWTETVLRFVVVVEAGMQAGCTQNIEMFVSHTLTHTQFCVL